MKKMLLKDAKDIETAKIAAANVIKFPVFPSTIASQRLAIILG